MHYEIRDNVLTIHQGRENDEQQILRIVGEALRDPALPAGSHLIWNATQAPAQASKEKMKRLIAGLALAGDRLSLRLAVVVSNRLQFGLARMLEAYGEGAGVKVWVCEDLEEARSLVLGDQEQAAD